MVAHTFDPSALDVEAEGSEVQGHSQLHSEWQASLSCERSVQNKKEGMLKLVSVTF